MADIVGLRCLDIMILIFAFWSHLTRLSHKNEAAAATPSPWPPLTPLAPYGRYGGPRPTPRYTYSANMYRKRSMPLKLQYSVLICLIRHFYSVGGNFTPRTPPCKYRPLYESQSTTLRWLKALSLDIVVEMKFRSADDICGAALVIYCISSQCTSGFDCQKHAIPYALIRQRPVATMEIRHCRTLIYITIMNDIAWLSIIFSLTTTNDHYPIPHICNKFLILNGMIIHAINATSIKSATQSLAHMI